MKQLLTFFKLKSNLPVIVLLLFFGVALNSCTKSDDKKDDGPCGDNDEWYSLLHVDNHITTSEILSGGRIKYYFETLDTPIDICADEHAQCIWMLDPINPNADTALLDIGAKAYWKGLQGKVTTLTWDNRFQYSVVEDIGLKMAYQSEPAWLAMNLQVTINDRGSDALNRTFLKSRIKQMKVVIKYRKHKTG